MPDKPKTCSVCGVVLRGGSQQRAAAAGLCFKHWAQTDEGKAFLAEQRKLKRQAKAGPTPFRYYGCLPDEEAFPEGPFNRIRLAVSSSYAGKGKPRGCIFIVWTDGVVTRHFNVKQSDVGEIDRADGEEVDRSDLEEMARNMPALTERTRHYGQGDVYLV